jgi:hypothetical protein
VAFRSQELELGLRRRLGNSGRWGFAPQRPRILNLPHTFAGLVPSLLPGRDDEGFPDGLRGKIPQYEAYSTNDERDCPVPYPYAEHCYHVDTEAVNERSLALIVQDIIREDNIEETQDRMVAVYFYLPDADYGDSGYASAYAFRSEDLAKEYLAKYGLEDATVIDGVYIRKL